MLLSIFEFCPANSFLLLFWYTSTRLEIEHPPVLFDATSCSLKVNPGCVSKKVNVSTGSVAI